MFDIKNKRSQIPDQLKVLLTNFVGFMTADSISVISPEKKFVIFSDKILPTIKTENRHTRSKSYETFAERIFHIEKHGHTAISKSGFEPGNPRTEAENHFTTP